MCVLKACVAFEGDKINWTQKSVSIITKTLDIVSRKWLYSDKKY